MSKTLKANKENTLNLEDYVIVENRVFIMGDISGTGTKYLPMVVPPEVEKKVLRMYTKMPDGAKVRERNNAQFIRNGSGYLFCPQVS